MIIEDIRHSGVSVDLDIEDLKLLRLVLLSANTEQLAGQEPLKCAALNTMGAAIHAAVVAFEALPAEEVQR